MTGLSLQNISKRFGETTAVEDFSLDVTPGEFVALVGPSGCGKTTTLRIVAGLEQATGGRVAVGGRDVTETPAKDRNLAMVFQSYALYPHLTAAENIGFSLRLLRRPRMEIEERVKAAADRLEIGHLLNRRPKELSGGQRQRVAVARCIVREPEAFLFDEPLSNLDAKLRGAARVEIAKLQKSLGVTTLYVTHDQVEAMTMADRIVLMDQGRIRQTGAPMDLYRYPTDLFVATFLGAPAMNLLPGEVVKGDETAFISPALRIPLPPEVPAGPATLGVRPEALSTEPNGVAIEAPIAHVEHLGAETLLELEIEGPNNLRLTARLPGHTPMRSGEAATLYLRPEQAHLFGPDTRAVLHAKC